MIAMCAFVNLNDSDVRRLPSNNAYGCPEGQHEVWSYEFDGFNFHRPINGCQRGFSLCFKNGHWVVTCVTNTPVATLEDGLATVRAELIENDKILLHFPIALKEHESYIPEDFEFFNVDEEYEIAEGITLEPGEYEIQETETELLVIVDKI